MFAGMYTHSTGILENTEQNAKKTNVCFSDTELYLYTRRQITLYRMFFRRFLSQFSTDSDEILQGLFSSHAATAVKLYKNI